MRTATLRSLLCFALLGTSMLRATEQALHKNWWIQPASKAGGDGHQLSTRGFDSSRWQPAQVPSTVLGTLVDNGVYQDPFRGKAMEAIPKEPFQEAWWYRTEFQVGQMASGTISRLIFEGVNYRANVWLNGQKIADKDALSGTFRMADLDVSAVLHEGVNALAVEVFAPKPGEYTLGFVDWNPEPPDHDMGLFREVRLRQTGAVSLEDLHVQSQVDTKTLKEASLQILGELVNHGDQAISGKLQGHIGSIHFVVPYALTPRERKPLRISPEDVPTLRIRNPRLWWPASMGKPEMHELQLSARAGKALSDTRKVRFGIREVKDYINAQGHRGYKVNGLPVLIRGAAWVDDLFLREQPENLAAQFSYIQHMHLNTIRLEGFWGASQRLYDLADERGILVMAGFSCQWEWADYLGTPQDDDKFGMAKSPEDIELLASYLRDQVRWLRNHPSVFVWVLGSDKLPWPDAEKRYRADMALVDPTRPLLTSCKSHTSPVSGPSAVKMAGPYDYVTPNYWFEDRQNGGAFGFNTETGPGPQIPPISSLKRMLPEDKLWPLNDVWDYHCARHSFGNLSKFMTAFDQRYGAAVSAEDLAFRSQAASYEAMRGMFDAFGCNRGEATGVIQWMLNGSWPKMFWQLYDSYLMPNGAFYAARNACRERNAVLDPVKRTVYLLNETRSPFPVSKLKVRLLDVNSKLIFEKELPATCEANSSQKALDLPALDATSPVQFLDLQLVESNGKIMARNFYWLSSKPDVLNPAKNDWTYMPNQSWGDFKALSTLPKAQVKTTTRFESGPKSGLCEVTLKNESDHLAFFIEVQLNRNGEPILPILWEDNYISLLPHETRTLRARYAKGIAPSLHIQGWNLEAKP